MTEVLTPYEEMKGKTIEAINQLGWGELDAYEKKIWNADKNLAKSDWFLEACRDRRQKLRYVGDAR